MAVLTKKNDKRRHRRYPVGVEMAFALKGPEAGKGKGRIVDMSAGGMGLVSDAILEQGMSLVLRLAHQVIRGEVRSIRQTGSGNRYGLRFHKIDSMMGAVRA